MDYAQQQRNPAKHLIGLTIVVLLHVVVIQSDQRNIHPDYPG